MGAIRERLDAAGAAIEVELARQADGATQRAEAVLRTVDGVAARVAATEGRLTALEGPEPPPQPEPPPPAGLLRRTTYEEGDERAESPHTATSYGLGTTNEASRLGERAGVALLLPGDPQWKATLGFRSEWHGVDAVAAGVERWQGISYRLPRDWHQGNNPNWSRIRIIFQWHATGSIKILDGEPVGQTSPIYGLQLLGEPGGSPTIQLYRKDAYVRDGRLRGRNVPLWTSAPLALDRWYDFAFNTIWSTSADGKLDAYFNGVRVHRHRGATLTDPTHVYSKWGIYGQPTRILFDEVRIVEGPGQLAAVSP